MNNDTTTYIPQDSFHRNLALAMIRIAVGKWHTDRYSAHIGEYTGYGKWDFSIIQNRNDEGFGNPVVGVINQTADSITGTISVVQEFRDADDVRPVVMYDFPVEKLSNTANFPPPFFFND